MFSRIFSHTLLVEDLSAATRAYTRLLGREVVWKGRAPDAGTALHVFSIGGVGLEISSVVESAIFSKQILDVLEERGEGQFSLALETDSAAALCAELDRRGVRPPPPIEIRATGVDGCDDRHAQSVLFPTSTTRSIGLFAVEVGPDFDRYPDSAFTADPASCVEAIDHIVIFSRDPDASARLYGDELGLRLALDRRFEERGVRLLFYRLGGVTIEIAARLGGAGEPDAPDRFGGIAWRVPDVEAAHARIVGEGFQASAVREGHKPGTRVFTVDKGTHGVATLIIGPG